MKNHRRWLAIAPLVVAVVMAVVTASAGGASTKGSSTAGVSGSITVWVDAVRLPAAKAYVKAHPKVKVKIVTFDGDGNGATTLQAKIQLWNRTGKGWPDVIFSEQANDPVWMASKPFDFAAPVTGLIPAKFLNSWPSPSRLQCTVNGREICVQDNLAQTVLWYDKTLMDKFGYTVPTTWQEWAAIGAKVATDHPGYIIGNTGDSYSAWTYLWADKCPISQVLDNGSVRINSTDSHCTRMAGLLDPLIQNKTAPPENIFTPAFAKAYGGDDPKVLDDARADLVRQGRLQRHAEDPRRTHGRCNAAQVERRIADHDRSDRRRTVDHLEALQEPRGRRRLRHLGHDVAGRQGQGARVPLLRACRHALAGEPRQGSILRGEPGKAAPGSGQAHLEGLEHGHVSRPTRLVEHRRHATGRRQVAGVSDAGARRRSRECREGRRLQGRQAMTA